MTINTYLIFDGQCEAAFKFYEKALGGKIAFMMTHGESPMAERSGPEWKDKILHVRLDVGNQAIMGSDHLADCYQTPQGFSVSLNVDEPEDADRFFNALAEKATVRMPIQETFWAKRFGMLTDQFGIPWMINCEKSM